MKIRVRNEHDSVRQIDLRLKSIDRRFRCFTPPEPTMTFDPFTDEPNRMEIAFDDIREIDNLIELLKRFKDDCCRSIGFWEEKGE